MKSQQDIIILEKRLEVYNDYIQGLYSQKLQLGKRYQHIKILSFWKIMVWLTRGSIYWPVETDMSIFYLYEYLWAECIHTHAHVHNTEIWIYERSKKNSIKDVYNGV